MRPRGGKEGLRFPNPSKGRAKWVRSGKEGVRKKKRLGRVRLIIRGGGEKGEKEGGGVLYATVLGGGFLLCADRRKKQEKKPLRALTTLHPKGKRGKQKKEEGKI